MFKVSLKKVMDLVLAEERAKVRNFYATTVSQATGDLMDGYTPTDSEILKMFIMDKD